MGRQASGGGSFFFFFLILYAFPLEGGFFFFLSLYAFPPEGEPLAIRREKRGLLCLGGLGM